MINNEEGLIEELVKRYTKNDSEAIALRDAWKAEEYDSDDLEEMGCAILSAIQVAGLPWTQFPKGPAECESIISMFYTKTDKNNT